MKKLKWLLIILCSSVAMISCKDEKQTKAEKAIVDYEMYVDSLNNIANTEISEDWDSI